VVIIYITVIVIMNVSVMAWSWKKITCSKKEEAPFCRLMFSHVVDIDSNGSFKTFYVELKCSAPICHV